MKKLVIFGTSEIAELASYYFSKDSQREIAAYTVDGSYLKESSIWGLPLIPFETIEESYPPEQFDLFVALSYAQMNDFRRRKCYEARTKGFVLASYVSSKATIFDNVTYGDNCFILEHNVIQPFVQIGSNCTLWSGNHVGHHSIIKDDCFISSHVVISGGVVIEQGCFLGVNSTIRDHVVIAEQTLIGAGSLILKSTQPREVYVGTASEPRRVKSTSLRHI